MPIVALLLAAGAEAALAQLISPGKLSAAHAELEGVGNCTRCHELRKPGVADALCLDCHEPLRARIEAGRGLHAAYAERGCAACHKEHFGTDFRIVRFDTAGFDHHEAGFELRGRHAETACRDCHAGTLVADPAVRTYAVAEGVLDRTFLGLGTACEDCHREDDPHGRQFAGRACQDCHGELEWKGAERFDHDLARYRLTGLHREVACEKCHAPSSAPDARRYAPLDFATCASCHEDPHRGSMGAGCERCHTTAGWQRVDRRNVESGFDHTRTGFRLVGKHAQVECAACHAARPATQWLRLSFDPRTRGRAYPVPRAESCVSCHPDYHERAFERAPGGVACDNCHGQDAWLPTSYDIARHNRESRFELTGSHLAAPCTACHRDPLGSEAQPPSFRFASLECVSCHGRDDPHGGQFAGRRCEDCHDTRSFRIARFDHDRTRYPLDGAHRDVPCASCHKQEPAAGGGVLRRYKPLGTACRDCHANDRIP
jgi:hypothetical protein